MDEHALLTSVQDVLAQQYGHSDCSWRSLNTHSVDDERVVYQMYRVDGPNDASWVVCAAHDALMTAHTFRWGTQVSPSVWLERRATLLAALASQGYPVAQVIRALGCACREIRFVVCPGDNLDRRSEQSVRTRTPLTGRMSPCSFAYAPSGCASSMAFVVE